MMFASFSHPALFDNFPPHPDIIYSRPPPFNVERGLAPFQTPKFRDEAKREIYKGHHPYRVGRAGKNNVR